MPLDMGLWARQRAGQDVTGLVHHSDRGVQYRAIRYTERIAEAEAVASVGSKGDSYDCEDRVCATAWGLTLVMTGPAGCPCVDVSALGGGGVHLAAGRVGSDLIGA